MLTIDVDNKTFMVYVAALVILKIMKIHLFCKTQIALLTRTKILAKYSNLDIFSLDSAAKLPKNNRINNYLIDLLEDKQLPYGLINSLKLVELEILKTYIKANLASGFIKPSKASTSA